jgi:hypothetical protein
LIEYLKELSNILERNKSDCHRFMEIIEPKIEHAKDEHERLYWHHIYEEEEQRFDRLNDLLPQINDTLQSAEGPSDNDIQFIHMLQDISLEKFGLHNFEEHLELGHYWFKETEDEPKLEEIREVTSNDYQKIKEILQALNGQFNGSIVKAGAVPTDEKDNDKLKASKFVEQQGDDQQVNDQLNDNEEKQTSNSAKKRLTVGSLRNEKGGNAK